MDEKIITFESYSDPMLAEIIKARLEANEIECYIADGNTIGANPLLNNALGGVKIKIFARDLEKCRHILTETEELQTEELPDGESEETCPYCHSTNVRYGTATTRPTNWLGAVVSFLFMAYPVIARKAWHCFNCGKDFD